MPESAAGRRGRSATALLQAHSAGPRDRGCGSGAAGKTDRDGAREAFATAAEARIADGGSHGVRQRTTCRPVVSRTVALVPVRFSKRIRIRNGGDLPGTASLRETQKRHAGITGIVVGNNRRYLHYGAGRASFHAAPGCALRVAHDAEES